MKAQADRVALLPVCRGVMRLLCLSNFASMVLPLARLHSLPLQFGLKQTYRYLANLFEPLKFTQEAKEALLW